MEWVQILGCPITKLSLGEFVDLSEQYISSNRPRYVAVVNVAKLVKMRSDEAIALCRILNFSERSLMG